MTPLDEQTQALLAQMKAGGFKPASQIPLEESRAGLTQMAIAMAAPAKEVHATEDRTFPGPDGAIPIRIYRPRQAADGERLACAVFFHGGGFYLGNLETHDHVCRNLCANADILVVAVEYRLAPENKFPAGVEDCYAAACWVAENAAALGIDGARMALVGDSAGGALVVSTCLAIRERGGPHIAYQVVIYPGLTLDDGDDFPSRIEYGSGEYFMATEDFAFFRGLYFNDPESEADNPLASPIRAGDFSGLPPALVITAGYDPCRDEGKRYAERLAEAGVDTEYKCYEGTIHPFFLFDGPLDVGKEGQAFVASRVKAALGVPRAQCFTPTTPLRPKPT